MQLENQVRVITLILGSIAGFCDTLTYTSANGLLSAHITGSFILFAGRLVRISDLISWLRLITFPVFVLSVIAGSWLARRSAHRRWLLACEGIVLCLAGLGCMLSLLFNPVDKNLHKGITYPVALGQALHCRHLWSHHRYDGQRDPMGH